MSQKYVSSRVEGNIGWITLNRPDKLNAIIPKMMEEINQVLNEFWLNSRVKCIIVNGAGGNFSAGADIKFYKGIEGFRAFLMQSRAQSIIREFEECPKPIIAAIEGYCLGRGLEIALACDFRIGADNAILGQPEIRLGLIPGAGGTLRLPRIVGFSNARRMILLGLRVNAMDALKMGLLDKVVPKNDLVNEAENLANKLSAYSSEALALAKYSINSEFMLGENVRGKMEALAFSLTVNTSEARRAIEEFLARRKSK